MRAQLGDDGVGFVLRQGQRRCATGDREVHPGRQQREGLEQVPDALDRVDEAEEHEQDGVVRQVERSPHATGRRDGVDRLDVRGDRQLDWAPSGASAHELLVPGVRGHHCRARVEQPDDGLRRSLVVLVHGSDERQATGQLERQRDEAAHVPERGGRPLHVHDVRPATAQGRAEQDGPPGVDELSRHAEGREVRAQPLRVVGYPVQLGAHVAADQRDA